VAVGLVIVLIVAAAVLAYKFSGCPAGGPVRVAWSNRGQPIGQATTPIVSPKIIPTHPEGVKHGIN